MISMITIMISMITIMISMKELGAMVSLRNYIQLPATQTVTGKSMTEAMATGTAIPRPYSEMLEFALAFTAGDIGRTDKLLLN